MFNLITVSNIRIVSKFGSIFSLNLVCFDDPVQKMRWAGHVARMGERGKVRVQSSGDEI
jgi:hypothetical protein